MSLGFELCLLGEKSHWQEKSKSSVSRAQQSTGEKATGSDDTYEGNRTSLSLSLFLYEMQKDNLTQVRVM